MPNVKKAAGRSARVQFKLLDWVIHNPNFLHCLLLGEAESSAIPESCKREAWNFQEEKGELVQCVALKMWNRYFINEKF